MAYPEPSIHFSLSTTERDDANAQRRSSRTSSSLRKAKSVRKRLSRTTSKDFTLKVKTRKIRDVLLPGWKFGGLLSETGDNYVILAFVFLTLTTIVLFLCPWLRLKSLFLMAYCQIGCTTASLLTILLVLSMNAQILRLLLRQFDFWYLFGNIVTLTISFITVVQQSFPPSWRMTPFYIGTVNLHFLAMFGYFTVLDAHTQKRRCITIFFTSFVFLCFALGAILLSLFTMFCPVDEVYIAKEYNSTYLELDDGQWWKYRVRHHNKCTEGMEDHVGDLIDYCSPSLFGLGNTCASQWFNTSVFNFAILFTRILNNLIWNKGETILITKRLKMVEDEDENPAPEGDTRQEENGGDLEMPSTDMGTRPGTFSFTNPIRGGGEVAINNEKTARV